MASTPLMSIDKFTMFVEGLDHPECVTRGPDGVTYAGGEVILWPIVFIGPRVGLFHTVGNTITSKKWFVSIDFGIGL